MKKLIGLVIIFILKVSLSFAQETVHSQIIDVTLFPNQALIKRQAEVEVRKGLNELFLELETFHVDRDSVSARVFGKGEISSVQFKEIYLKELPQENIKALGQKIEELKKSRRIVSDEKDVLDKKELFLTSVIDFSQTQVPQDIKTSFPKVEELKNVLMFLGETYKGIKKDKESFDSQIEDIDREIEVLEKELASLMKSKKKTKNVIEVLFDSEKDQRIKIEANYLVEGAFWEPVYKVSVPLSLGEVNLIMLSKIKQKTGEDWENIALTISNVVPLKGVALPSLASWFLDIERPRPIARDKGDFVSLEKATRESLPIQTEETLGHGGLEKEEAQFVHAERKELPLSFEYQLPKPLHIKSKDKETLLPLFAKTLQGEFFYYAIPKTNALTFLVCRVKADKELLSGPLNVHFGGRFIGKTFLSERKAGENFHLSLGADREVKVTREKIKDKVKETFFGTIERQTIIKEMAFKITIENLKEKPIRIIVLDSIPVAKTDKIVVKDVKITPQPKVMDYQDKEGVLLWEFELKSKEKKEIDIEFVATYPKDKPVLGL